MNLTLLATIIVVLLIVLGVFKSDKRKTSGEDQKFWKRVFLDYYNSGVIQKFYNNRGL